MPAPRYLDQANRLIAAFPQQIRTVFLERCELVDLHHQDVLVHVGQSIEHVHFPIDSFIANIFILGDGHSLQVGLIGHEGMTNGSAVLGARVASLMNVVQGAGRAFQISCRDMNELFSSNKLFTDVVCKHIAMSMDDLARNMACASSHSVEQRLARWLLVAKDCAHSSELALTQEELASMLGVRRERVARVATLFQENCLISYNRGNVTLVNESGLQRLACQCYRDNLVAHKIEQNAADPALFRI